MKCGRQGISDHKLAPFGQHDSAILVEVALGRGMGRGVGGWQTLDHAPAEQPLDRAA